ncbi:MAG TPA: hypothetical protein P5571_00605 [Candidatus Krumholzibacteria bacterium]|nr:hypothetical protein [Candidatus Krumholzibacteria bacterium]HRX49854.1 hypothetical protein [Candidatus Krumholzibacteria bacterium]
MNKRILSTALFLILAGTAAIAAAPGGVYAPDRSGALDAARSACQVGSVEFAGYQGYYTDFWTGGQTYFQLIQPTADGCACAAGVTVANVDMYITANAFSIFVAQAELWSAVDDGSGCMVPGGPLALSDAVGFSGFPSDGVYHLSVPFGSPCLTPGDAYFIAFHYLDSSQSIFSGVAVDSTPEACEQYVKTDGIAGYHDPVAEYGWVGNYYVFADLDCCADPVANDVETWSTLKRSFR